MNVGHNNYWARLQWNIHGQSLRINVSTSDPSGEVAWKDDSNELENGAKEKHSAKKSIIIFNIASGIIQKIQNSKIWKIQKNQKKKKSKKWNKMKSHSKVLEK